MPDFILRRVEMRDADDTGRPGIPLKLGTASGSFLVHVTARGYQHFTGRRHGRVSAMHAAYRRRSR